MMKYHSTRNKENYVSSSQAIVEGLCKDGGLFVPESLPKVDFSRWIGKNYRETCLEVFRLFFTDFKEESLLNIVEKAYQNFDEDEVVKIHKLKGNQYILELWHGPTMAFKDLALQVLPLLFLEAKKNLSIKEKTLILTATSGDTGKAAIEGFSGLEDIYCLVFYPHGKISPFQEKQMLTASSNHVRAFALDGDFDQCQAGVKRIFQDQTLKNKFEEKGFALSSANSINIGRLIPQVVYYIYSYLYFVKKKEMVYGESLDIIVPTGNFGNVLAARYAKEMGLPLGKIIAASNENKVICDFLKTGIYDRRRGLVLTSSPSMDILMASNLERYLHLLLQDEEKINHLMGKVKEKGIFELDPSILDIYGGYAGEEEVSLSIQKAWENNYLVDPHTAVALSLAKEEYRTLIVSTASIYKFTKKVLKSLSLPESPYFLEEINRLRAIDKGKIPPALDRTLRGKEKRRIVVKKAKMEEEIFAWLGDQRVVKEITVRIPGTSANLGPAFDLLGMAWKLYNTISFQVKDRLIRKEDIDRLGPDKWAIWKGYLLYGKHFQIDLPMMDFQITGDVPSSRGLGSSVTCYLAGVMLADKLVRKDQTNRADWFALTTELEGHPDNAAPGVYGGLCFSYDGIIKRISVHPELRFYVAIPDFKVRTEEARRALPKEVSHQSACKNLLYLAFLLDGLQTGDEKALRIGLQDELHQPYRKKLIASYDQLMEEAKELGALGGVISGAGPSLLFISKKELSFEKRDHWKIQEVHLDTEGSQYVD